MKPRTLDVLVFAAAAALAAHALHDGGAPAEAALLAPPLPELLSATGLHAPGSTRPRDDHLAFVPQYPLWSDGAAKRRWIHLPPGTSIDASDPDAWSFPPGTRLWKEFAHGRAVETRYIERLADGTWRFATYVWDEDGREARLAPEDGAVVVRADVPGGRYVVPSRQDCLACHEGPSVPVLGFSALQLSPDRDGLAPHAEAREDAHVGLAEMAARGLVRGLPAALLDVPPRVAGRTPVERAALGYLHANCGHCHNAGGALDGIDLALAQDARDPQRSAARTLRSLLGHDSRFRPHGAAATQRIASDGGPSVLALRMRTDNPLARMPPLGVAIADDEGIALVERWIHHDLQRPSETQR